MNNKVLVRLSLCCSAFGLLLLFVASTFIEAEETGISELESMKNDDVFVKGRVVSVKNFDNLAVVEVAEVKSVDVVVFDRKMLNFEVDDNVSVSGELRNYKGKKEIVAERIKVNG